MPQEQSFLEVSTFSLYSAYIFLNLSSRVFVSWGHNLRVQNGDPTAHAEVVAIRWVDHHRPSSIITDHHWPWLTDISDHCPFIIMTIIMMTRNAGRRRDWEELTLVSTLSPCIMCTGAALLYKIKRWNSWYIWYAWCILYIWNISPCIMCTGATLL